MPPYKKLLRDKIPQVIENNKLQISARISLEEEYITEVTKKFAEELKRFEETRNPKDAVEELADILKLIHVTAELNGSSLEEARMKKLKNVEGSMNISFYLRSKMYKMQVTTSQLVSHLKRLSKEAL